MRSLTTLCRVITPPRTGMKTKAIASDAVSAIITVIGRNFINSPTIPGQNSNGVNTASVVTVEAVTGQAMRIAAEA